MIRTTRGLVPLLAAAAAATVSTACYAPGLGHSLAAPQRSRWPISYVIEQDQLLQTSDGTLLSSIAARISQMGVRHAGSECPQITLRGPKSFIGANPGVYVDGNRAANTCVLEMLNPGDVHRVEVYPMGVTQRPGYDNQAGGLILVFLRDGNS